jgi:hypothetical protein
MTTSYNQSIIDLQNKIIELRAKNYQILQTLVEHKLLMSEDGKKEFSVQQVMNEYANMYNYYLSKNKLSDSQQLQCMLNSMRICNHIESEYMVLENIYYDSRSDLLLSTNKLIEFIRATKSNL